MKFMFFEVFSACKKWNSCFWRFFKLTKNEMHVFWGFLKLAKMKFMFFDFFLRWMESTRGKITRFFCIYTPMILNLHLTNLSINENLLCINLNSKLFYPKLRCPARLSKPIKWMSPSIRFEKTLVRFQLSKSELPSLELIIALHRLDWQCHRAIQKQSHQKDEQEKRLPLIW